jgi:sugar lactone lactonase YvrE
MAIAPAAAHAGKRLRDGHVHSGRVLLGLGKRLGMAELPRAWQASRPLQAQVLITIDAAEPRTSISDGCADRHGNFVFGTANIAADRARSAASTNIRSAMACAAGVAGGGRRQQHRLQPDGRRMCLPMPRAAPSCNAITMPNGPGWACETVCRAA